jgi:hypothetical protein
MRRAIIHFGLHKTGSSSIQSFLRNELRDERFYYPASGETPALQEICHNRALSCAFQHNPETNHMHAREGVGVRELRARGDWFKQRLSVDAFPEKADTIVLSAEELSNFEITELESLVDFLAKQGLVIEAIGYVRKYKRLQESRFQQSVRAPGPTGRTLAPDHPYFAGFAYRKKLEKFWQVMTPGSVTLDIFERAISSSGCIVDDFCHKAGITRQFEPAARENEGLSMDAVRLLYTFRKFHPAFNAGMNSIAPNQRLVAMLCELKGERVAFHSSLLRNTESRWRADVDWISAQLGEDMLGDLHGDDEGDCLRSEADLFAFSPSSLEWLASASQMEFGSLKSGDPARVARAMRVLADRARAEAGGNPGWVGRWTARLRRMLQG